MSNLREVLERLREDILYVETRLDQDAGRVSLTATRVMLELTDAKTLLAAFEREPLTGGRAQVEACAQITDKVQGHDWDTAQDGWGVVYGVSRCKKCKAIATEQRLTEVCSGVEDAKP